jgi:hypothetical protein
MERPVKCLTAFEKYGAPVGFDQVLAFQKIENRKKLRVFIPKFARIVAAMLTKSHIAHRAHIHASLAFGLSLLLTRL